MAAGRLGIHGGGRGGVEGGGGACLRAEADIMRPVARSFPGAAPAASGETGEAHPHLEANVSEAARMGLLFRSVGEGVSESGRPATSAFHRWCKP